MLVISSPVSSQDFLIFRASNCPTHELGHLCLHKWLGRCQGPCCAAELLLNEITSFCGGAPGTTIIGHMAECLLRDVGSHGDGENLKSATQRDGSGQFETGPSWRCSLKGKRQQVFGVVPSQGPSQSELLFQPFSSYKALLLQPVSLHPADNVWALLPSHSELLWMQIPYFSAFLL